MSFTPTSRYVPAMWARMGWPFTSSIAFGLYLGHAVGFRGASLFATGWVSLLDCTPVAARDLAIEAKRIGLIDLRIAGDVVDLALDRLDPAEGRS